MGRPWMIKEDQGDGVILENPEFEDDIIVAQFGKKNLVIDPVDEVWEAAWNGELPINYPNKIMP